MTEIAPENLNAILQSVRRSFLPKEALFRLWRAAIKDDDNLVDEIIQKVYDDMISANQERAECVMELIVRRNRAAGCMFRSLLHDTLASSGPNRRRNEWEAAA